jgi:A/G-specific adenine glycosylase
VPSISEFQERILAFYRHHGRDLPWRRTTDPYAILVSEIMLQQTQVPRVEQKYPAFLETFPDFSALAAASLPDLLTAWQGMGYNRRALALQKTARIVVDEYEGELPDDPEILESFPGIGRATARSICAFAFNMPTVFIETNIRRVFIHCFFPREESVPDAGILPLVERTLYVNDPRTWYNALMDLGTRLRDEGIDPNRRSRHYVKQAPFEGSDRKIRGQILRELLAEPGISGRGIVLRCGGERSRVRAILAALEEEGFIQKTGDRYSIASR